MIKNNIIYILIIVLSIFLISSLLSLDHFKPINSLKIKYNSKNVIVPKKLKSHNKNELSLIDKVNSELSNHPLTYNEQIYSIKKYPFVGAEKLCKENNDCETINSICEINDDPFSRKSGIGTCVISTPNKSIFDIKY